VRDLIFSFSQTIGPAASTGAFSLLPKATIALPLAGRLIPQATPEGLADVSYVHSHSLTFSFLSLTSELRRTIFNGFVHGVPSDLVVHGDTAGPAECSWLNEGIKQLAIAVVLVSLPRRHVSLEAILILSLLQPAAADLEVINSITLNSLTLMFSESEPWAPSFSTDNTVAKFQLPFAFPVRPLVPQ
jgi:hypothetical protein